MTVKQLCGALDLWFVLVGDMELYLGHQRRDQFIELYGVFGQRALG